MARLRARNYYGQGHAPISSVKNAVERELIDRFSDDVLGRMRSEIDTLQRMLASMVAVLHEKGTLTIEDVIALPEMSHYEAVDDA